jgi:formylglycine-generating enzyme required for sulfatase activity
MLTALVNGVTVTSKTVNVVSLAFAVQKTPNPPTAEDPNISITPLTRNFGVGGGGAAIVVSGSETWQASASDPWITLNATNGAAGYPVAYTVSATTNVESRTGYVYVSGHVHTVTQAGLGGSIAPERATYESLGGQGTISVTAPDRMGWQARPNVDWLNVTPTSGVGEGEVTYSVAPFNEVSTRQGTLTVAGQSFTVFQYGRRMKLAPTTAAYDYFTHVIPITVDALAITEWSVTPNASWISVVDAGKGKGGDLVTIAIAENPSWKARTGTVSIGTETFTVTQEGRTALAFAIDPVTTTASVEGANGMIAVTATPDLPWSAASKANWLTVYAATANGAGNGNVVYSAAPNPTLYERTGTIVVTPGDTNVAAKTHTATQPAAISALSATGYEFEASGESCEVRVSLSDIVAWNIENTNEWLTVVGATNRVGPGTVTLQATANTTVYPKSGTVTIARKPFEVSQKARGVEVEYETKLFGTDGGSDSISIHPDGQVSWTAVSSDPTWITIFQGDSGTGDGEILYIVSPYVGTGEARTGTITVGDKVVWITQRGYDLSINPAGSVVAGNNGAGEFGVSAGIADVWRAIVTEPWITIIEGYDEGTGSGMVRFAYADNNTGKMRTGKIIVAGEVYTLTQKAREFVAVSVEAGHGGTVEGAGTYDLGATVTLTAVPDSGYAFSHWTGAVESMENPLVFRVDVPKSFTAVFAPLPIAFTKVTSATNGVTLAWNPLAWATTFRIFRGVTSVPSSATVVAELPNTGTCEWLDETGEVDVEYWYWIEAEGVEDDVMSDPMTGKKKWGWPAAQNEGEVAAALDGAADARLSVQIGSVEEYEAFRAWAAGEGREEKEVRDSAHAWPSYVLGAGRVFEGEPEIRLSGVEMGRSGTKGISGVAMRVCVTVRDGGETVAVDASKVAALVECTSDLSDWTGEARMKATVTQIGEDGDKIWFEVTPGDGTAERVFLRIAEGALVQLPIYLVVDLSGGPEEASWPVTYLRGEPEGGWTDEYKTTKLVLRRIEPGTFMMGGEYQTTLTKPYYMGVFEVTQKQYELVTGRNPAWFKGDKRPVENVHWNTIRGNTNWPASSAVAEDSFMGRLRARTGLAFDLPTEAQWEYACRAGTTTAYSHGDSADGDYMWYSENAYWTNEVGTKHPNGWDLYDMHGNALEWCLDWFGSLVGGATDPRGADSGTNRVLRGGSWIWDASFCTSFWRGVINPSYGDISDGGFRLVRNLSE